MVSMTCRERNNLHKANHFKPLLVPTDAQGQGEILLVLEILIHPREHPTESGKGVSTASFSLSVIFAPKPFKNAETAVGCY